MSQPIPILYVDDYPLDRELVRDALEREHGGFTVFEAKSRRDFEEYLQSGGFDIVLSDFNILGFEGLQVLEAVKGKYPEIPVIIVTGTGSEEVAAEAIKRGAADYIIKTPKHIQRLPHIIHDVLEKKQLEMKNRQMESAVVQSRELLTNLSRLVPGVIYQYRLYPDGHSAFPYSSSGMNTIYEYSPEEVREDASPVFGRLHPDDYDMVSNAIFESARTLEEFYCEFRVILPKQGLRWRWSQAHPERMPDGSTLWHGIISDITDRKLIEEKLDEERILLRTLIDNLPDRIYVMDTQGRKTLSNTADFQSAGFTSMEDIIGKTDLDVFPPDLAKIYWERDRSVINSGKPLINVEEPGLDSQGNPVWLLTSKLPLRDTHGKVVGLVGIGRDITERKQAEKELQDSEEKFKYIFDHSPVGKSLTKITGEIYVNQSFCDMLGYSEKELKNRKWQEITHPDDIELSQKVVNALLSGEKETARFTKRYLKKDGSIVWADVSTSIRRDTANNPMYLVTAVVDITDRKLAEAELQESELRFHSLYNTMVEGVSLHELVYDDSGKAIDYRILDTNLAFEHITGIARDRAVGALASQLYGTGKPPYIEIYTRVAETLVPTQFESTFDPLQKTFLISVFAPTKGRFATVFQDITERKKGEEALRLSEKRFRTLFEHAPVGVALIESKTGRYLDINPKYCAFLGYTREEALQKSLMDVSHPGELQANLDQNADLVKGKIRSFALEKRFICKGGTIKWGYLTASPLWSEGETPSQYIHIAVVQDITERKQLEAQLKNFYNMLNAGLNEIYTFDAQTLQFDFVSAGALNNLRYTLDQMKGMTPLDIKPEFTLEKFETLVAPLRQHKTPLVVFYTNHQRSDGSTYPAEVHLQLFDQIEHPIFLAVVLDITQHKQAEEEIRQLNLTLEKRVEERTRELRETQDKLVRHEKLAVLGQLAGGLGHELRNPLGVINNAVYYLKMTQPEADEKVKSYLSIIENEVKNGEKIIHDLISFTRGVTTNKEVISLPDLINNVLQRLPVSQAVSYQMDLAADCSTVRVDPFHLEQVMQNLLLNAFHAVTQDDSGLARKENKSGLITIKTRKVKKFLEISIADNGIGIPPENIQKIFEPLFTTKVKGMGLGLAISKKLIEANGGTIEVSSAVGKGSTFTVQLPTNC